MVDWSFGATQTKQPHQDAAKRKRAHRKVRTDGILMNIFAVNNNPTVAAHDLPDKLVVKMPTESVQMLCPWAFSEHGALIPKPSGGSYGTKGFAHHPCSRWVKVDPANAAWLILHAEGLCEAYTRRYGKIHGTTQALRSLRELFTTKYGLTPEQSFEAHTPFALAMPDKYKDEQDRVGSYRRYVNEEKGYAVWKYSAPPHWWNEELHRPARELYLSKRSK
jgi:Pyrimidine dimer DNA glycosylase